MSSARRVPVPSSTAGGRLSHRIFSSQRTSPQRSAKKNDVRRILSQIEVITQAGQRKLETVRRFYEEAWSSDDLIVLDALVAEDHVQADRVWQSVEREGRESVKRGIGFIQKCYPDVRFTVDEMALTKDGSRVFAKWTMRGTFEGSPDTSHGVALLTVNDENLISRTEVFRQATRAEVELASRSEQGPVAQGALLQQRSPSDD